MDFETIIGLEIHVELATKSKMFCACPNQFASPPNHNICPICLGMPGTLPLLNRQALSLGIRAGRALNCRLNRLIRFDRKNYFYPDLPKGYQISQRDMPLCGEGYINIELDGRTKKINIERIHLEEDAGRLIHLADEDISLVDYNRAGVPLIEIVTKADFRGPREAVAFLKLLKAILEYTGVSDCKMEEGSLRCDVNISIRKIEEKELNTRVEIKNLNSFREVFNALTMEEERQRTLYMEGKAYKIQPETRRWDSSKGVTIPMRTKEDAEDYRYFVEADIKPLEIEEEFIAEALEDFPELPQIREKRIIREYGIGEEEAAILIGDKKLVDYFEEVVSYNGNPQEAANWITGDLLRFYGSGDDLEEGIPIGAKDLAELMKLIQSGEISYTMGRKVFRQMLARGISPKQLVVEMGLEQISHEGDLEEVALEILRKNPQAVEDYKEGKSRALGFLMGQAMKATGGRANPQLLKGIILESLQS